MLPLLLYLIVKLVFICYKTYKDSVSSGFFPTPKWQSSN